MPAAGEANPTPAKTAGESSRRRDPVLGMQLTTRRADAGAGAATCGCATCWCGCDDVQAVRRRAAGRAATPSMGRDAWGSRGSGQARMGQRAELAGSSAATRGSGQQATRGQ
ncbi:hypothetical protein KFK09_013343 [Dendrobium nobile]|uniref:Uncharacterized protein n=1 Tax=Dendrobium nobile TaxID=94219 RepID=A0A8T3B8P1_DENNO|nr:hypothetical protein KFK09_013343 [Dendrobium nobile]